MNVLNKRYAWRRCYAPNCQNPVDPSDPEAAATAMPLCFPHELSDNAWRVLNYLEGAVALYAYKGQLVVTDEALTLTERSEGNYFGGPRYVCSSYIELEAWLESNYWDWEENGCTTHEQQFIHADPVRWEYDYPEDYPF